MKDEEIKACPCLHTEPCDERCTCVNKFSSFGCRRCCTYGSKEQQKKMAEYLAKKIDEPKKRFGDDMFPNADKVDLRQMIEDHVLRRVDTDKLELEACERLEKKTAERFKKMTDKERETFLGYFDEKERKEIVEKYGR